MEQAITLLMRFLQYVSMVYVTARATWKHYRPVLMDVSRPHKRYFIDNGLDDATTYDRVPEDQVYVEEWVQGENKRWVVKYEGDVIPHSWSTTPFEKNPKTPWVWVGDRETEIDLTRTFNRFLTVGNVITLDLVLKLIMVTERTNLIYIESGTFKELKFPGDGITIEEYVD